MYAVFTPATGFPCHYVVGVILFITICFASSATGHRQPTSQTGFALSVPTHSVLQPRGPLKTTELQFYTSQLGF